MRNWQAGQKGEILARQHLVTLGYEVIANNFRAKRGEIDLVAKKDGMLCFFEVKYRTDLSQGHPAEAITKRKLRHLRMAITEYLLDNVGQEFHPLRVNALCIVHLPGQEPVFEMFDDILGP